MNSWKSPENSSAEASARSTCVAQHLAAHLDPGVVGVRPAQDRGLDDGWGDLGDGADRRGAASTGLTGAAGMAIWPVAES